MSNKDLVNDINYGPLSCLIGKWQGSDGMDIAPEPDGDENNPYYETIWFHAAGDVTNAEEQVLAIVRYHQEVRRKSNDKVFHDRVGYWLWDSETNGIIQTLTIPRAVTLLASGKASVEGSKTILEVAAAADDPDWNIIQAPFMNQKAKTTGYKHRLEIEGDRLNYQETTILDIYDQTGYEHTDKNVLVRAS